MERRGVQCKNRENTVLVVGKVASWLTRCAVAFMRQYWTLKGECVVAYRESAAAAWRSGYLVKL